MSRGAGAVERTIMHAIEINAEYLLPLAWIIERSPDHDPLSDTVKSSFRRAAQNLKRQNRIDIYLMGRPIRYVARTGKWINWKEIMCVCAYGLEVTDEIDMLCDVIADGAYHYPDYMAGCRLNWFFGGSGRPGDPKRLAADPWENQRLQQLQEQDPREALRLRRLKDPGRWYPDLIGVYPDHQ
jgi:hypothetical protein